MDCPQTFWQQKFGFFETSCHMGGLVVKMLASCAGGPVFDPRVLNPKYSMDLHQQNPSWMSFG